MAKHTLKVGEKILFGIFGVFITLATISFVILEVVRHKSSTPLFETKTHFKLSPDGQQGSQLFREARCTSCHRAMRNGTNMALSLDGVGSRRTKEWIIGFLAEPEKMYGARTIDHGRAPKEAAYVSELPQQDLYQIATFLSELRSEQGSASSPLPPEGRSEFIDNMVKVWAPEEWASKYQDVRQKASDETPEAVEKN